MILAAYIAGGIVGYLVIAGYTFGILDRAGWGKVTTSRGDEDNSGALAAAIFFPIALPVMLGARMATRRPALAKAEVRKS